MNDSLRESRGAEEDRPNELERAIGEYLDRLNAGGRVDRWEILAEHPGIGQEILDGHLSRIEAYLNAVT